MPPPIPQCSSWAYSSLNSPSHFNLPRYGSRVGLHIVLFEMLWGGGEEIASIVADVTDGGPNAKAERPEPIPYRPETGQHTDRGDRNEFVELARCRHCAWHRAPTVEKARCRRERLAEAAQSLARRGAEGRTQDRTHRGRLRGRP